MAFLLFRLLLQVAVVDAKGRVVVFDVLSKEIVFQENGASRYCHTRMSLR